MPRRTGLGASSAGRTLQEHPAPQGATWQGLPCAAPLEREAQRSEYPQHRRMAQVQEQSDAWELRELELRQAWQPPLPADGQARPQALLTEQ